MAKRTSYKAPPHAVFSNQIVSSVPCSQSPSVCERRSITPIQNQRQNYSFVYSKYYVSREQTGRQKDLDSMVPSVTRIQSLLNSSWIKFWFDTDVPKYLNCARFSNHLLAVFISWFCPTFWWQDSNMYLVFFVFTFRSTSFLASITDSVFLYCIYVITQKIIIISTDQQLMCPT
jgi:hypothetical protein